MRPDGSWPIDSERDQRSLHYGSASTSHLVTIATALQSARGINLFDYEVDGRSVHNAVDFVVASMKDPGPMNQKYAISCPDGGRLNDQGLGQPDLSQYDEAGYLLAYAERFPDRDSSKYILTRYQGSNPWSEKNGGAPQCLFAPGGGGVTRVALVEPTETTPEAKLVFHPREEISHSDSGPSINSFIIADIAGAPKDQNTLAFNVTGPYSEVRPGFIDLRLVLNDPLDDENATAAAKCGATVETRDDGSKHLIINFSRTDETLTAKYGPCLEALSGRTGFTVKALLRSFADIGIGFVTDGTDRKIKNPDLKQFFQFVAVGKVVVTAGG
jgi:hypothetical protein